VVEYRQVFEEGGRQLYPGTPVLPIGQFGLQPTQNDSLRALP
jgi:hypothetical protein